MTAARLPPPIQWEPCSAGVPAGIACRQMKYDWLGYPGVGHVDGGSEAWSRSDGTVVVQLSRWVGCNNIYRMVADADGPVQSAILELLPSSTDCTLGSNHSLNEGKIIYTSYAKGNGVVRGAIGGNIHDLTPQTYRSYNDGISREYVAGASAFFEWGPGLSLFSWIDGSKVGSLAFTGRDLSLQPAEYRFSSDALFITLASSTYGRIAVYTQAAGVVDLITAGNDPMRASLDLGTDGHDMVWTEASGPTGTDPPYAMGTWMTAPFTTLPASVQPRRLRTEFPPFRIGVAFAVGCGYAAQYASTSTQTGVRIVRLSDGQSWPLMTDKSGIGPWQWMRPLAVTCSEVFFVVSNEDHNVARVRIDSLGPGEPAN